jgi:hypothetical protein
MQPFVPTGCVVDSARDLVHEGEPLRAVGDTLLQLAAGLQQRRLSPPADNQLSRLPGQQIEPPELGPGERVRRAEMGGEHADEAPGA